jgi:CubicO group peptidase (beta-lactamase class C family)
MSISKLFLSPTVMQLWERGMIDLEEDISQYLPFEVRNPHFPDQKITPYMLLTHSSGLAWPTDEDEIPDFHHFYTNEEPPPISEWLPEYILPEGLKYWPSVWKDFQPGKEWLYSNIGTSLLALIVEQISGEDYREFCRKNILEPLEMGNSSFKLSDLSNELLVTPYTDDNHPIAYYTCRHYPAGFLSANMEDFSHFVIAMLNYGEFNGKRILQKVLLRKCLRSKILLLV